MKSSLSTFRLPSHLIDRDVPAVSSLRLCTFHIFRSQAGTYCVVVNITALVVYEVW